MTKRARDVLKCFFAPINRTLPVVALLVCSLVHAPANAIPIGGFSWNEHTSDECEAALCGAFFSVDNFSTDPDFSLGDLGNSFFDVLVNLQTDTGLQSLVLGDILAGGSSQSIDDLFGAIIQSAGLTFAFGNPALAGSIRLLDEAGELVTALTGPGSVLIDYTAPVVQVAEPSVLLLLVGGLVGLARRRKANTKHFDAKDRDRAFTA